MKKKFIVFILYFLFVFALVSCGKKNVKKDSQDDTPSDSDTSDINTYKTNATNSLDLSLNPTINSSSDLDIKNYLLSFYNEEISYINGITDLSVAKEALSKVEGDINNFIVNSFKPYLITKLNNYYENLTTTLSSDLLSLVKAYYDSKINSFNLKESLKDISDEYYIILNDLNTYINDETLNLLIKEAKNKALVYLDDLVKKLPYSKVEETIKTYYDTLVKTLDDIKNKENIDTTLSTIKSNLDSKALSESKNTAIESYNEVVESKLQELKTYDDKEALKAYAKEEIKKLNEVSLLDSVDEMLQSIINETNNYVNRVKIQNAKSYLKALVGIENRNAYDYLPETMSPYYKNNLVKESDISYDFTSITNISKISTKGYGEQWQMVGENINQSLTMAKVFNVGQTVLTEVGNVLDIYIENSYSDTMDYSHSGDKYSLRLYFTESKFMVYITFTDSISIAGLGSFRPKIIMEYDLETNAKGMFISLDETYRLKYVIKDDAYEMALDYGIDSGSRSSYLSINNSSNMTVGHIYEYTTIKDKDVIKACADFYIDDTYVSVVGNKASGMVAFSGYINELYKKSDGLLLGYEVRETLSAITYNTLWFNLSDISGINSVKVCDKTDSNPSTKSTVDVYINSKSTLFTPTYNTKLSVKTSRKYDIEYRNRYYYTYDEENDKYIAKEVKIPMMFIQQGDNFDSFTKDMEKDNEVAATVLLSSTYINKIISDTNTKVDTFITNKELMSSEVIKEYLNQYE